MQYCETKAKFRFMNYYVLAEARKSSIMFMEAIKEFANGYSHHRSNLKLIVLLIL